MAKHNGNANSTNDLTEEYFSRAMRDELLSTIERLNSDLYQYQRAAAEYADTALELRILLGKALDALRDAVPFELLDLKQKIRDALLETAPDVERNDTNAA